MKKKKEEKTYTGKAQYIHIAPLQLVGKQTKEESRQVLSDGLGNYFSARINESLISGVM